MKEIRIWQIFTAVLLVLSIILSWSLYDISNRKDLAIEEYEQLCDDYYDICMELIVMLIDNTIITYDDLPGEVQEMLDGYIEEVPI